MKAGLQIIRQGGGTCTSAFVSRDIPWPGAVYLLTAGHCINVLGEIWVHNGLGIGTSSSKFYSNGGSMDVGYVLLSVVASPGNQLFVSTPSNIRNMNEWYWNGQQTVGATVCHSGRTSGYQCAGITATDQQLIYSGVTLYNMWKTNVVAGLGDSGSPVFSGLRAYGVLSGGSGSNVYYTPLGTVFTQTGKQVCITSGC